MASSLLMIPTMAAATGCFRFNEHAKCPILTRNVHLRNGICLLGSNAKSKSSLRSHRRRLFQCKSQLAELAPAASAVYGVLLLGGGLFAYTRSGSKGSLFGGLTGAALLGAAYFLMQVPETKDIGDALGFGAAFLFTSIFGIRLAATRKLTPAGPLLGISIGALVVFISAYLENRL